MNISRKQRMEALLKQAFLDATFTITDDSAQHHGHAGAPDEGESHYTVTISSSTFKGLSRVATHKLVNDALTTEFSSGLHALKLIINTL